MDRFIIAVVDDLFFASKIRGTAEQLGVKVQFVRNAERLIEAATSGQVSKIIVDLHSQQIDPVDLAKQLKGDESIASIELIGFFSHVQTELQRLAEQAGFDRVMPRSAFVKQLAAILSADYADSKLAERP